MVEELIIALNVKKLVFPKGNAGFVVNILNYFKVFVFKKTLVIRGNFKN